MNLGYILREGIRGLNRNVTMTIALVITTAISLGLLATGFLVTKMTEETKEIYLDRVEVMVQFNEDISRNDPDCSSAECQEVRDKLVSSDNVESVTYRSQAQSYERFVELFQDTDPQLVAETSEDALPAALHVRLEDPLDASVFDEIRNMEQVSTVVDQADDLNAATENLDSLRNATFLFAGIQAIAAIFLIANMVQLAAFHRRDEIAIMRMVGASRWYTQAPFVIEALLATVLGSLLSIGLLFMGKNMVIDKSLESLYESQLIARIDAADIWAVSPIVALTGMLFAGITAQITLRWYVRT
ncbi:MAG: permease-like cell division protein FtsX [Corynebacterium sp.]|nr:permease-like cell division protein FtsX [Corynebacterium sp.]